MTLPTLLLTPRFTPDSQVLWRAAIELGWNVERLRSWHLPDHWASIERPVFYLEALFGPTLAQRFGIDLVEAPEDWLVNLPWEYKSRDIALSTLKAARRLETARFIKPPNDKSFPAKVYMGSELPEEYPGDMSVLIADIVEWEKEFRCYIRDRELKTFSVYLRKGVLQRDLDWTHTEQEESELRDFVDRLLKDQRVILPRGAVIDVGVMKDKGWGVVEQNAVWGAGIYGCDGRAVLEILELSSRG